ncbi:MAG: hypothetical protein Kow0090_07970 [Myxococcota bacterium]
MKVNTLLLVAILVLSFSAAVAVLVSCGASRPPLPPIEVEARNIGLYMEVQGDERLQKPVIILLKNTIEQLYYTETIVVPTIRARKIEELDAQIYFRLSELMIDDLVIIRGEVRSLAPGVTGFLGSVQLWNVAMGKEIFNEGLKAQGTNDPEGFPANLKYAAHKVFATKFNEPGLYPRVDLEKVGDLFYERKEFSLAQEMYRKAGEKLDVNSRFAMQKKLSLKEKMELAEKEIRKRGIIAEKGASVYKEEFKFFNIPAEMAKRFTQAFGSVGLRGELKEITNRPVAFYVQFSDVGKSAHYPYYVGYTAHIVMRFDQVLYTRWTAKEPRMKEGYLTLSFNPYAKVMFQALAWRDEFLSLLSEDDKETYKELKIYLHLAAAIGDEVAFQVKRSPSGMPEAPTELIINIQEYENHKVLSADPIETVTSGYFLINPDTIPATMKLVMEFFGIQ